MRTKTLAILVTTAILALVLLAAAPARAPRPPKEPTPPAEAPAPPAEDHVFFFSAGGTWLGVQIADIDDDRARELGLKEEMGAEIQDVLPDSPAAVAGLKEGDVVLEYQGTPVQGVTQLTRMVRETPAGRTVRLRVYRDGSSRDVSVKVTEREREHARHRKVMRRVQVPRVVIPEIDIPEINFPEVPGIEGFGPMRSTLRLGVMVDNLTDQLGQYFGVRDGEGVLVRFVRKGSPAEAAGLRAGDVIVKVDGERISDASDLRRTLRDRRDRETPRDDRGNVDATLTIVRERKEQSVKVTMPRRDERRPPRTAPPDESDAPELEDEEVPDHEMEQIHEDVERIRRDLRSTRREILRETRRLRQEARRMALGARVI